MAKKRDISIEELLIWAYQTQAVGRLELSPSDEPNGRSPGWAAFAMLGKLGTVIDGAGSPADLPMGDAYTVHDLVCCLDSHRAAEAVVIHARAGTRPDYKARARHRYAPERPEYVAAPDGTALQGRVDLSGDATLYTPVVEVDRPADIKRARGLYRIWREALVVMRDRFIERPHALTGFLVTPALPPARPWTRENQHMLIVVDGPDIRI